MQQLERIGYWGVMVGVVLGGLVAAAGCDGAGDAGSGGNEAELHGGGPFQRGHRRHDSGSVGATGGAMGAATGATTGAGAAGATGATAADAGPAVDCDICTQAQRCCDVVEIEGPGCSFSAETCASTVGQARPAYVNACLTYLVTVRGAWRGDPPAECR